MIRTVAVLVFLSLCNVVFWENGVYYHQYTENFNLFFIHFIIARVWSELQQFGYALDFVFEYVINVVLLLEIVDFLHTMAGSYTESGLK